MLKEFLELLSRQAVEAAMPKIIPTPGEPKHRYLIAKRDGEIVAKQTEPAPRQHHAGSLKALVDFVEMPGGDFNAVIWHNRQGVTAVLDDLTRRDLVTMPLVLSQPLQTLQGVTGRTFNQKAMILLLRTTFKNSLAHCDGLITTMRRLRFESGQVVDSAITHGKTSVGKTVRDEVSGVGALPEFVLMDVPVFENQTLCHIRGVVEVAIEPIPDQGCFQLIPVAGELERIIAYGEMEIGATLTELLKKANVPVFFGSP